MTLCLAASFCRLGGGGVLLSLADCFGAGFSEAVGAAGGALDCTALMVGHTQNNKAANKCAQRVWVERCPRMLQTRIVGAVVVGRAGAVRGHDAQHLRIHETRYEG